MSERRRSECRHPDNDRVEHEAERQIDDGADNDGDDVVFTATDRDRRRARIGTVFQRDAVIDRPSQHRAE